MCSIMGYLGEGIGIEEFEEHFAKTKSRGPDDTRIIVLKKGIFGFHRLSIMGLTDSGMQPFELNGSYVICNGEIYGFEAIKKTLTGYTFKSDSDCEILLPMYELYGEKMFAKLDAEFVLILYDAKTDSFVAARDPIGIRPMYYGYDRHGVMVLASEAKNLTGLCDKIMPFPPG
ncbi:MAG: asparagine synthetase B, partial [Lachnospiraceae bacterium]|nr:asparagine synthetase B [Lachnospiraceae bacterium]